MLFWPLADCFVAAMNAYITRQIEVSSTYATRAGLVLIKLQRPIMGTTDGDILAVINKT
jgi:hypothetical protein